MREGDTGKITDIPLYVLNLTSLKLRPWCIFLLVVQYLFKFF